jgi:hypothetical protein
MPLNTKVDANAVLARVLGRGPDALLTRGEAAALLASRVMDSHDSERTSRNRIGMMLDRAADCGDLARLPDGRYAVDEIAHWAMSNFSGEFTDLPNRPRTTFASLCDGFGMEGPSDCEGTPGDSEGRLTLIEQLREQIRQLKAEKDRAEIERHRELVARFEGKKDK